jgi:gliding motility-associated-like protein
LGTAVITAAQAGNANYNSAANVSQTLTVIRGSQSITFAAIPAKALGDAKFNAGAAASSGLAVTYTSSNTSVAVIDTGKIKIIGIGTTVIKASQAGNTNFSPATDVSQTLTVTKANQTITFAAIAGKTFGTSNFDAGAVSSSGLPVTYTSANTAVAVIESGKVKIVGVGTSVITANQAGNTNFNAAPAASQTLTVGKSAQAITFAALPSKIFGDATFDGAATTTSGLPITYTSNNPLVAVIDSGKIKIIGVGTAVISVSQAGNANYLAATTGTQTLTVVKAAQTVSFVTLSSKSFGSPKFDAGATASSGLPITYVSSNALVAVIDSGKIKITGVGSTVIKATQAGNSNYNAAVTVSKTLVVVKGDQSITFAPIPNKAYSFPDFNAGATASSGLPVTYTSSNAAVAVIDAGIVKITGVGAAVITATQAGNANYNAATDASQTLTVVKVSQVISFAAIPAKTFGTAKFDPGATTTSGLPITYTSNNALVAVIDSGKLKITGAGTAVITATQQGNANFKAGTSIQQTLTVTKGNQTINFSYLSTKTVGDDDFDGEAKASSGLPITYTSSDASIATIINGKIHVAGAGDVTITATQPGNANYNAATSVSQVLNTFKAPEKPSLEWTWQGGDTIRNQLTVYGTKGVPSADNKPGARRRLISWTDNDGNFWLFGGGGYGAVAGTGFDYNNDMWKFDVKTKQWAWVNGSNQPNQYGVYGTKGVPSATNTPGARDLSVSWKDPSGNLWLYGGVGYGATQSGSRLGDLWKFDIKTYQWTWMSGDGSLNPVSVNGTKGVAAAANTPGNRYGATAWADRVGNLWLFGGFMTGGDRNQLWKYDTNTGMWTWVNGDNAGNPKAVYGTMGTLSFDNKPGARENAAGWVDPTGALWMFGGSGYSETTLGTLNDLWKYVPDDDVWIWVKGDKTVNTNGYYGSKGYPSDYTYPGARQYAAAWWDDKTGKAWLYGGLGYGDNGQATASMDDLWSLDLQTREWTWVTGGTTGGQLPVYNVKNVSSPDNNPGSRYGSAKWIDKTGDLWIWGGGYRAVDALLMNDLWKFGSASGITICKPLVTIAATPSNTITAGTSVTFKASVVNGGTFTEYQWKKNNVNISKDSTYTTGTLANNDEITCVITSNAACLLDSVTAVSNVIKMIVSPSTAPAQKNWTWVSGDPDKATPVYGTRGVFAAGNKPGKVTDGTGGTDAAGNFWMFSGTGVSANNAGTQNELWKYNTVTGQWAWMGGGYLNNPSGYYGQQGVPSANNWPIARQDAVSWFDKSGNFWVFGGWVYDDELQQSYTLNDLWKYNPTTSQWTWVSGDSDYYTQNSAYGTKGAAAAANQPPSRSGATSWTDSSGNLWMFGGNQQYDYTSGALNDLWKFNPTTSQWTWVSGFDGYDQYGTYGSKGTASAANVPGARSYAGGWADAAGNLWLFGGSGQAVSSNGALNDLWKFNIASGQWTWASGNNAVNQKGIYGTRGVAVAGNAPGARTEPVTWTDTAGDLWLFSGAGLDNTTKTGYLNDLWRYGIATGLWTWMGGDDAANQLGVYGAQSIAAATNKPGGRHGAMAWKDKDGNPWIYGGSGYSATGATNLNDLWILGDSKNWGCTPSIVITSNLPDGVVAGQPITFTATATNFGTQPVYQWKKNNVNVATGITFTTSSLANNDVITCVLTTNVPCTTNATVTSNSIKVTVYQPTAETSMTWAWTSGDNTVNVDGIFGAKGVAAATNKPSATHSGVSYKDENGDLWMFGGTEKTSGVINNTNALWKYKISTNQWTWVSGDEAMGSAGNYGLKGSSSATNVIPAKYASTGGVDVSGNLWIFGGEDGRGKTNDLWKFNPVIAQWTWVAGDNTANQPGVYSIKGVSTQSNKPGARSGAVSWTDASGNIWIFGGDGYNSSSSGSLNDLWKFTPGTGQWTWVSGDDQVDGQGDFGTKGVASANNLPMARSGATSWTDKSGNLWLYGGEYYDWYAGFVTLDDLWKFNPVTREWTWVSGEGGYYDAGSDYYGYGFYKDPVYGVRTVPADNNKPGSLASATSYVDKDGNFWMFGDNDLWKYYPATNQWAWLGGTGVTRDGIYGTKGTASASNKPGARDNAVSWIDNSGKFWMFGGTGQANNTYGFLNDLWRFGADTQGVLAGSSLKSAPTAVQNTPDVQGIKVHQALSPNGDGISDVLIIDGITQYPDNKISIMNASGKPVTQISGYDNGSRIFDGRDATGTLQRPGTYYYVLEYVDGGERKRLTGYIIIKY